MPDDKDEIARRALSIASALAAADPGEKADARRMDESGSPLFWRQAAKLDIPQAREAAWLRFTRMVALLTPASATESVHEQGRHLGAVLADGGQAQADLQPPARPFLSEQRLARLIAARGEQRTDALERAIRMLARNHPRLDVVDLARTVLGRGDAHLARNYYRRLDHARLEETENV